MSIWIIEMCHFGGTEMTLRPYIAIK